ncbi:N-acetylneuraminate synthase family protein [bacterium]|nr:N-acetylneuraminate synthase family protein [bacterium]
MNVRINNKSLDYTKTHIVFEGGPTHNGIESAKTLVDMAVEANADSIKFQLLDTDRLMATGKDILFEYSCLVNNQGEEVFKKVKEPLYDILKRRELTKSEWKELKEYCDTKGIHFFSTALYKEEVDFLVDELKVDSIKIASSDISQIEFIKYCAMKNINIQLDTGNADLWEIEKAVIAIEDEGNENIIIHHCPSGYPAALESINLKMITTLKEMFPNYLIAFSDHTNGWEMDIAAISFGAGMIEKTITEDRYYRSCEHSFSLEKDDAIKFVNSIRDLEKAIGNKRRVTPADVRVKRLSTRRSAYLIKDIKKGEKLENTHYEFKRPGFGLLEDQIKPFEGNEIKESKKRGEPLLRGYFI